MTNIAIELTRGFPFGQSLFDDLDFGSPCQGALVEGMLTPGGDRKDILKGLMEAASSETQKRRRLSIMLRAKLCQALPAEVVA